VEKIFRTEFENAVKLYCPLDNNKRKQIEAELEHASAAIGKLDKSFSMVLYNSLKEYTEHVKKARHSIFQDFEFPSPPGAAG